MLFVLAIPSASQAQFPSQAPQLPPPLYVRLAGPPGMKVTIYRGGPSGQSFDLPCVVGFRAGYRYRIELSGLPEKLRPQASANATPITVCPTLDVLGSLRLTDGMRAHDYPATVLFTEEDLALVQAGALINKVMVLEKPDTALPIATTPGNPIEITVPPSRDPLLDAQQRGRPLMVLHMGERQATQQELAALGVPGTVLLPGESVLPPPRDPPCLPWLCYSLVDPRTGLPCPAEEICFHDGGDGGLRAGVGPDGKLVGLDPSDTVAQYMDSLGRPHVAVSNKVCLCVPRYLLVRTAITPATNIIQTGVGDTRIVHAPVQAQLELTPILNQQEVHPVGLTTSVKASALVNLQQTIVIGKLEGVAVFANAEGTGHVTGSCPEPVVELMEKPLVIIKWPDKCDLQIGDIVTFYIRYHNQGQKPITGIVVSDSLTTRLEYVRDSARSDRDALFTTAPNEADSAVLRWEITGSLPPGQMGTVSFQARVR